MTDCEVVSTTSSRGSLSREKGRFETSKKQPGGLAAAQPRPQTLSNLYCEIKTAAGCGLFTSVRYDELAGQGQGSDRVLANQRG